jgi:integrase
MEITQSREPWNKGKLIGQKPPLKLKDIWAIRIHLQLGKRIRDLAMFNLAIDSKLRGCDLVNLRVRDVTHGNQMLTRAIVIQRKTQRPVQFELTEDTRNAVVAWIAKASLKSEQYLFPSRLQNSPHVSTRQKKKWGQTRIKCNILILFIHIFIVFKSSLTPFVLQAHQIDACVSMSLLLHMAL